MERIGAVRRAIVVATGIEEADVLAIVVQAHDGACIVQGSTPLFQIAHEVVHTAIGSKVLAAVNARGVPGRNGERQALPGNDTQPVKSRSRGTTAHIERITESIDVVPVVGEKRKRIRSYRGCHAGIRESTVGRISVEVALDVGRVFRRDGQAARNAAGASGQGDNVPIDDLQSPAEERRRILARLVGELCEGSRPGESSVCSRAKWVRRHSEERVAGRGGAGALEQSVGGKVSRTVKQPGPRGSIPGKG